MTQENTKISSSQLHEILGQFKDEGLFSMSLNELRIDWILLKLENFRLERLVTKYSRDRKLGPSVKKAKGDEVTFYLVSLAIEKDAEGVKITRKALSRLWDEFLKEVFGEQTYDSDLNKPIASDDRLDRALTEFRKIKKNWETTSNADFLKSD